MRLQTVQNGSAGKGEVRVIAGNQFGRDVLALAGLQLREGDRRIYVIESSPAPGDPGDPLPDARALFHEGPDDHKRRRAHRPLKSSHQVIEAEVEFRYSPEWLGHVSILRVPGNIVFQEEHAAA